MDIITGARDDRNTKAWATDSNLMEQYQKGRRDLEARIDELDNGQLEQELELLRTKFESNLADIGRSRQQSLYDSKVVVVGSDTLAQMVLSCLAGMGVGNVYFMDNKRISSDDRNDFLCTHDLDSPGNLKIGRGEKKVYHIKNALEDINEDANYIARHAKFNEAWVYKFKPEIIIDATNDPISKKAVLDYSLSYSIPIISASSNDHIGVVSTFWPRNGKIKILNEEPDMDALLHNEFEGSKQGPYSSGIAAGIVAEEYRKFKFKYEDNDSNLKSNERFVYNAYSNTRHGFESHLNQDRLGFYRDNRALVAGAGALGNFVSLELALMGVGRIDVIDMDYAEVSNLNRQILLRGYQNMIEDNEDIKDIKKSELVAKRIREIDPNIDSRGIYGKFGELDLEKDLDMIEKVKQINSERFNVDHTVEEYIEKFQLEPKEMERNVELITYERLQNENYDVIFGCFDNKYARLWLNNFAVKNKIPYIDGGTNAQSGQVAVYIPGKTNCVDCQLDLIGFPAGNWSCVDMGGPSTIMPNIITGSEMVAESINVFNPNLNEDPIKNVFQYNPMEPIRLYIRPQRGIAVTNHEC